MAAARWAGALRDWPVMTWMQRAEIEAMYRADAALQNAVAVIQHRRAKEKMEAANHGP